MPELEFGQIDTKGSGVYQPVEIWSSGNEEGDHYGSPANLHNEKVVMHANAEYLNDLLDLQKRIKEKYEPQLILNTEIEGESSLGSTEHSKEARALLKPGAGNLYYT